MSINNSNDSTELSIKKTYDKLSTHIIIFSVDAISCFYAHTLRNLFLSSTPRCQTLRIDRAYHLMSYPPLQHDMCVYFITD